MLQNHKIGITGHTAIGRLGNSLYNHFSKNNEIRGYTRTDGFHIYRNVDRIIQDSLDCDIFINCVAHSDATEIDYDLWDDEARESYKYGQVELLKKWYENHKGKNHVIVNISCIIPWLKFSLDFSNKSAKLPFDSFDKFLLTKTSALINNNGDTAKSIDIAPGMMKFNEPSFNYLEKVRDNSAEVKHETIISAVEFAVEQYFSGNLISYIAVQNTPMVYDYLEI